MALDFHKMHGAGNDFVLIDARGDDFRLNPETAAHLADRRLGVGCDQILVLRDSAVDGCVARYEIWNADGSPAGQCGNGARCIGLYLHRRGAGPDGRLRVESPSGVITLERRPDGEYEVAMGVPDFSPAALPMRFEPEQDRYSLPSPWGPLEFGAVSMGNPHAVMTVEDIRDPRIPEIGAFLGGHEAFPEGCNIGFACPEGPDRVRLRVVERGAGETLACGSGACAAVAVLARWGRAAPRVEVLLPGGRLVIKWRGNGEPVFMKGPAQHVFRGKLDD